MRASKLIRRSSITRIVIKFKSLKKTKNRGRERKYSQQPIDELVQDSAYQSNSRDMTSLKARRGFPAINPSETDSSSRHIKNISNKNYNSFIGKNFIKPIVRGIKNQKGINLPFVTKGFNLFAELKKKREREKYPPGFIYNGTMGKIKEDGLIKRLSIDGSVDSDISDGTYGSYQMMPSSNQSCTKTMTSSKIYDFQKSPMFDRKEKRPDLHLKSIYGEEEDDPYYSEEELIGDEALDNYSYKCRNMYRLKEKGDILGESKKSPLLDFLLEVDRDKKIPKSLGMVNRKFK